ncbi:MAG: small multi-drug export protein [Pseudomonadota bacterium]
MLSKTIILFLITLLPFLELRASIPFGILSGTVAMPLGFHATGLDLSWPIVFAICVVSNMVLGIILYPVIHHLILLLEKIPLFGKFWKRRVEKTQRKIHQYVERWGMIGVALFIAVPLPGSGSYSGAIGAYLIGMSYRRFILANCIGVTIAGILVTLATMTGKGIWAFFSS